MRLDYDTYKQFLQDFYPNYSVGRNDTQADFDSRLQAGIRLVGRYLNRPHCGYNYENYYTYLVFYYIYQASVLSTGRGAVAYESSTDVVFTQADRATIDEMYRLNLVHF